MKIIDIASTKETNKTLNIKAFKSWDRDIIRFPCLLDCKSKGSGITSLTASRTTKNSASHLCIEDNSNEGIFYVKVPKTSSSTLGHITTRFSMREARRQGFENSTYCEVHNPMIHAYAIEYRVADRNKLRSFLWTAVRNPTNRAVSHYGMLVKFGEETNDDKHFISRMRSGFNYRGDFQLRYLATKKLNIKHTYEEYIDIIQNILDEYNFIGLYERLNESLVVLSMIMGMSITDVLYDFRPSHITRCDSLSSDPSWLTSGMREYLETEWNQEAKADFLLYNAVNKALDATIEKLGRRKVELKVANFERLMRIGTDLSNKIVTMLGRKTGCGIKFPRPDSDIDELDFFDRIEIRNQRFVDSQKEINVLSNN